MNEDRHWATKREEREALTDCRREIKKWTNKTPMKPKLIRIIVDIAGKVPELETMTDDQIADYFGDMPESILKVKYVGGFQGIEVVHTAALRDGKEKTKPTQEQHTCEYCQHWEEGYCPIFSLASDEDDGTYCTTFKPYEQPCPPEPSAGKKDPALPTLPPMEPPEAKP